VRNALGLLRTKEWGGHLALCDLESHVGAFCQRALAVSPRKRISWLRKSILSLIYHSFSSFYKYIQRIFVARPIANLGTFVSAVKSIGSES
jgi:hypothetical protein